MEHTTFTLREVLGCPVTDEFGTWQGQLADFSVQPTPEGREPVDFVLRDGYGEFVIPRPEALRLVRHALTATIATSVRIRGDRDPADIRLRSDLIGHRAVDLRHDRVIRVRDIRLTQAMGVTVVDAASVGPVGLFGPGEVEWMPWSLLVWLDWLLAGQSDAPSLARIRGMSAVRLGLLLSQLTSQERELLAGGLDLPEEPR
jgi:hypothetical protein